MSASQIKAAGDIALLQRLEALDLGYGLTLEGVDMKDGWSVAASVIRASDGFDIQATWAADHGAGIDPFTLRRTFTQPRYAADWLNAHLIEDANWEVDA